MFNTVNIAIYRNRLDAGIENPDSYGGGTYYKEKYK